MLRKGREGVLPHRRRSGVLLFVPPARPPQIRPNVERKVEARAVDISMLRFWWACNISSHRTVGAGWAIVPTRLEITPTWSDRNDCRE